MGNASIVFLGRHGGCGGGVKMTACVLCFDPVYSNLEDGCFYQWTSWGTSGGHKSVPPLCPTRRSSGWQSVVQQTGQCHHHAVYLSSSKVSPWYPFPIDRPIMIQCILLWHSNIQKSCTFYVATTWHIEYRPTIIVRIFDRFSVDLHTKWILFFLYRRASV